jgi:YHS domain-containing protein
MNTIARYGLRILLVSLLVAAFALVLGCGSKETAETPAPQAQPEAVDWTAYANPKAGVCPVCSMELHADHVEVASIGEKQYACCSSSCATMLAENPDKYLTAEPSGEESHEGHQH